ncbi:Phthiocerol synthesis polyketide synthase type I PpsA [Colletotrichum tanaceti]|uniref:Phthiocerol synthesis polyketide synthase type I PpsA n=1 Tax=Colletotrichum tanaceti TaxID=1306861 RepID=A0A4V6DGZ4_9PEZI|nr:Phthiocerol synthesis polyketide synthase type I PpsA [Colletotrichum tanaceti]TKW54686.1 Phthiocerol synthesis polyketide synthase type I PpsA [Colletotrichum tanaceti]
MAASPRTAPSAAFFCPVPFLVDKTYLTQLHRQIVGSSFMKPLADAILQTLDVWKLLASDARAQHVAVGARGEDLAKAMSEWIATGETGAVASQPSSIISFPLLIITGLCQWCSFLELSGQSHEEAIGALGAGGIQGYCGGILNAIAVASSGDSLEFGRRAANMYRTAFLLGVFMSEGEVGPPEGVPDMLIVRLKYPGQDLELMEQFPGIYASATTNPVTICFAGKKSELAPLKEYVAANKMFSIQTYPTGTGHDPRNANYLDGMLAIVAENDMFHLPATDALRVPVQSNVDGELLQLMETPADLARDVLGNVLCGRCEWYKVVGKVAARLRQQEDDDDDDKDDKTKYHSLPLLGGYDCVPAEPFNQASVKIAKIDVALTLREVAQVRAELASYSGDDAVAVVGAACRLPGASNLDELWDLLQSGTSRCEELRPDRVPLSASHRASLDYKFANGRKWFGNFVEGVDQFDNELFGISHSEAAWMDPQQRILLELAYEALDSYGHLGHRSYSRQAAQDVGCFVGGTLIEYNEHTSTHAATAYSAIGTMQAFQCGRRLLPFKKGQMLAIHAPLETVRAIIRAVDEHDDDDNDDNSLGLEMACHNSASSHVVVGTAQQIERSEAIIAQQFKPVRCQKVDVTHGFHSRFVDDILPGLQKLDDSLDFQKPRMRLELCLPARHEGEQQQQQQQQPQKGHIGRHARDPVFFEDAIARLTQDLGPSVWLEAGTDSPIIPMAKRVVPDAAAHSFHPFNFKAARQPETVLCQTTVALWRSGVDTTYWPLIEASDIEPLRLPAYRFSRKSFWTDHVDHAAHLKTQLDQAVLQQTKPSQQQQHQQVPPSAASKLVSISSPGSSRFHVNVSSGRFQQLVRGHAVCDQPMCPASMYMECVGAAIHISSSTDNHLFPGPAGGGALRFESVAFNHPLTLSNHLQVSVILDLDVDNHNDTGGGRSWTFAVESTGGNPSGRSLIHARGRVAVVPSPNMQHIKALIGHRSTQLRTNPQAESKCRYERRRTVE